MGIGAEEVSAAVHGVAVVADLCAGWDEDWRIFGRAAAGGEGGCAEGGAVVYWDDGVETQCCGGGG